MSFVGPLVLASMIGCFCGLWAPLFVFVLLAVIAIAGSLVAMVIAGLGGMEIMLGLLGILVALEICYVAGLVIRSLQAKHRVSARPASQDAPLARSSQAVSSQGVQR